jgi:TP901 family phage tail tape measure protein
MAESNIKLRVDASQAEASLRKVNSLVGQLGLALGAVGVARNFFKGFQEADKAAAAVSTLGVNAEKLKKELLTLSAEQGGLTSQTELLAASYDVASAGFNSAAQATDVLRASSLGAVGGLSDLNTVANATTSVLNAYGLESSKAQKIVDGFIQTQNDGKIIVAQYANQIGRVAPISAAAGVGIDELNAAISAVTATGVPVESTFAGLRQVIAAVIKPTSEASTRAKELGLQFNTTAIKTKGFGGFLEDIIEKTGGSEAELSKLFGSVEALAAIMPLANDKLKKFNDSLENQKNSFGVAKDASEEMGGTVSAQITKIVNNVGNLARTFDEGLGPAIKDGLAPINDVLQAAVALFTALPPQVVTFSAKIVALTAVAITLRKVMLLTFLAKLPRLLAVSSRKMLLLRLATVKLKVAMMGLKAALPFGFALIAIDLVIGKLIDAQQAQKDFNNLVREGGRAQVEAAKKAEEANLITLQGKADALNPQQLRRTGLPGKIERSRKRIGLLDARLSELPMDRTGSNLLNLNIPTIPTIPLPGGETEDEKKKKTLEQIVRLTNTQSLAQVSLVDKRRKENEHLALTLSHGKEFADVTKEVRDIVENTNLSFNEAFDLVMTNRNLKEGVETINKQAEATAKVKQQAEELDTAFRSGIVDAITSAIDGTKSLGDSLLGVIKSMAKLILQQKLMNALSGFSITSFLGFADGGRPPVGRPSIVGERGPELFVPGRAGTIVPNHELGGGGSTSVVVNVDASGTNVEGDEGSSRQLGALVGAAVQNELIKQQRPGGLLSR